MMCPSCGGENPDGFRFCGFCGAPLSATAAPLEERKVVTVLFCDLVGFTARSDQADPEDVKATLRPFHTRLKQEIEAFGGTLDKFIGDAAFGVFGSPVAHEDDAERAVRAALSIQAAIEELNAKDSSLGLAVRQGINTGEAVVAPGAGPQIGEAVTGDVVNTASRLQSVAPVGGIVVGEHTYRVTRDVFVYEPLAPVTVKGKTQPLPIWIVIEARARLGPPTRTHTAPLVGRAEERTLLEGVFTEAARDGGVRLVTILGEPGVGKSRLVAELERFVEALPELVVWRHGRCLPYGEGIAFWALAEIVKAHAGILESDTPENAWAKLTAVIPEGEPDGEWLRRRLAPLIGVEAGSEAQREELFAAWRRFLELMAERQAAVFVFEDIHWADTSMLDFIEHVAATPSGRAQLVVCTARRELEERRPEWASSALAHTRIDLQPLSKDQTVRLLSALLDDAALPPRAQAILLDRAGGNPLYAEEFVRMLDDQGMIRRGETVELAEGADVTIPDSIQALIAARLDTLVPRRKSVLQDASVVGKEFWTGAVVALGDQDEAQVRPALDELSHRELVVRSPVSSLADETEYAFWHAMVRDACYAQIPRAARAVKHRAAGQWIEKVASERPDDVAEVVAHHFATAMELADAAGLHEQAALIRPLALRSFVRAGERALALDVSSAGAHFKRALELAPPGHPERAVALAGWAEAARLAGRPAESAVALEEAIEGFLAADDRPSAGRATATLASVLQATGSSRQEEVAAAALDLLRPEPPGPDLVAAYARMAGVKAVLGNARATRAWADRAIALAERLGLDVPARVLGFRGYALVSLGDPAGVDDMRAALRLALARGEGRDAAVLYNNLAVAVSPIEGPRSVLAVLEEGAAFCDRRGIQEFAIALDAATADQLADVGEWDRALALSASVVDRAEAGGDVADVLLARWAATRVLSARGGVDAERAASDAPQLVEMARESGGIEDIIGGLGESAKAYAAVAQAAHAIELLREVEATPRVRESAAYPAALTGLVRTALGCGDIALAERFVEGVGPDFAYHEHALCAAGAMLAEARGDLETAAHRYAEAAERWETFGVVPEHAWALLGLGRCLTALGRSHQAGAVLPPARDLFAGMGAAPAVAQIESLLDARQA